MYAVLSPLIPDTEYIIYRKSQVVHYYHNTVVVDVRIVYIPLYLPPGQSATLPRAAKHQPKPFHIQANQLSTPVRPPPEPRPVSPLATTSVSANRSPTTSPQQSLSTERTLAVLPEKVPPSVLEPHDAKFFQHGVGSQMMLASATSRAKQMFLDSARRHLSSHDVDQLQDKLSQV